MFVTPCAFSRSVAAWCGQRQTSARRHSTASARIRADSIHAMRANVHLFSITEPPRYYMRYPRKMLARASRFCRTRCPNALRSISPRPASRHIPMNAEKHNIADSRRRLFFMPPRAVFIHGATPNENGVRCKQIAPLPRSALPPCAYECRRRDAMRRAVRRRFFFA